MQTLRNILGSRGARNAGRILCLALASILLSTFTINFAAYFLIFKPHGWQITFAQGPPCAPPLTTVTAPDANGTTRQIGCFNPATGIFTPSGSSGAITFTGVPTGSCTSNQLAINTLTGALYTCLFGAWVLNATPNITTGTINGADYLSLGPTFGQIVTDGSWANGSSTLNSAGMAQWCNGGSVPCVTPNTSIVGRAVFATDTCRTGVANDTGDVRVPTGTVLSVVSSTQITVSTTSTAAVGSGGCIVIGLDQASNFTSLNSAVDANTTLCPTVTLPVGVFLTSSYPQFLRHQPTACANNFLVLGQEFGGLGGYLVKGSGSNSTIIVLMPSLNPGTGCTVGVSNNACFFQPGGARWEDFQITGAGNAMPARADGTKLAIEAGSYVGMKGMIFSIWGTGDVGFAGLAYRPASGGISWMQNSLIDTFGNIAMTITGTMQLVVNNVLVQNTCGNTLVSLFGTQSQIQSTGGFWVQQGGVCSNTNLNRTLLNLSTSSFYTGSNNDTIHNINAGNGNSNSIFIDSTSAAILYGNSVAELDAGVNSFAIQNNGTLTLAGGSVFASAGTAILNQASGTVIDNSARCAAITGPVTNSGKWLGSKTVCGTQLTTANIALTSGWGTAACPGSCTAIAGSDSHSGRFTVAGAAGAAGPQITLTFPRAYNVAPSWCNLFETGANDLASLPSVSAGTPSTTSVLFTFTGTPVAVTYQFDYACGPQ